MPEIEKLTLNDPETQSADIVAGNVAALQALFPEAFSEGRIDFEVLKQVLGGAVEEREEKYGLNWHGKRRARQIALTPSTGTLLPCPQDSVDWDTTQNLMIEGDNLEVLKLLQKSYAGKVKLIYIDPPYNTGGDFVYPDNFSDSIGNYLEITGQVDGGRRISSNTETSGRFHTDWLNMMYPRLKLARSMLADDGVIFITIDDNEISNLRMACDEVFGEENLRAIISWQKKYSVSNNFKGIATVRDFILVYSRSEEFSNGLLPRDDESKARYINPDNDPRGPWKPVDYWNMASVEDRPNLVYPIRNPHSGLDVNPSRKAWKFARETYEGHAADNRIWWGQQGTNTVPALKLFLSEVRDGLIPHNWWPHEDVGHTDEAKKELDRLFDGSAPFDTPKPLRLLERIFQVANLGENDIVLDFFAGSGSTAHALMKFNARQNSNCRFILVQLPEPVDRKDYVNIAEITKERLRRSSSAILAETPLFSGDTGFRAYKLASSNICAWEPVADDLEHTLLAHAEHLVQGRTEADVLAELLLKLGLDLCVPVEQKQIAGKTVHSIGAGALIACLSDGITREVAEELGTGIATWRKAMNPAVDTRVVFKDSGFADNDAKLNMSAILTQAGITDMRSL